MSIEPKQSENTPTGQPLPNQGSMVAYCCADLLWATKIKSTADAIGVPCRPVRNTEMLEARLNDSPLGALVVDLEAGPVVFDLIARLRGAAAGPRERSIRIVAFGPHVAVDQLSAAKHAGADAVLTRGAIANSLPNLLRALAAGQGDRIPSQLSD